MNEAKFANAGLGWSALRASSPGRLRSLLMVGHVMTYPAEMAEAL